MQSKSFFQSAAYCVMGSALCWVACADLQSNLSQEIWGTASGEAHDPLAGIDSLFQKATADGNAAVIFHGFSPNRAADGTFISKIYFRGNYTAYPKRIYVCDDGERFDKKKAASEPFAPSDIWLGEHNVHCILYFTADPAGHVECTLHKI